MHPYRKAAEAIRVFGFPKFATEYLRHTGDTNAPESWDLPSVTRYLGETIGADITKEAELAAGLDDVKSLCGDAKLAEAESFTPDFHAVKVLLNAQEKTASAGYRKTVASEQRGLWERMKAAAERTGDPVRGLAGEALRIWSETERTGTKTASSREEREDAARSFASNYLVDVKIAELRAKGEVTEQEAEKLATLSAEAAIDDLCYLTREAEKTAGIPASFYTDPRVIGAGIGAVGGAGIGAWDDKDNRLRGAAMGGLLGMPLGAVGGQVVKELMDQRSSETAQALAKAQQAQRQYDLLSRAAEDLGSMSPAANIIGHPDNRKRLMDHFNAGNKDLPIDMLGWGKNQLTAQDVDQLADRAKAYSTQIF